MNIFKLSLVILFPIFPPVSRLLAEKPESFDQIASIFDSLEREHGVKPILDLLEAKGSDRVTRLTVSEYQQLTYHNGEYVNWIDSICLTLFETKDQVELEISWKAKDVEKPFVTRNRMGAGDCEVWGVLVRLVREKGLGDSRIAPGGYSFAARIVDHESRHFAAAIGVDFSETSGLAPLRLYQLLAHSWIDKYSTGPRQSWAEVYNGSKN